MEMWVVRGKGERRVLHERSDAVKSPTCVLSDPIQAKMKPRIFLREVFEMFNGKKGNFCLRV